MGDPAVSIAYKCTIDGFIPLGIWTKIEGLGFEYQVTEYREGGVNGYTHKIIGPCKYTNLRLSRPVDSTSDLSDALAAEQHDQGHAPDDGDHRHDRGAARRSRPGTWPAWCPVKWTGPTLDIMSNNVATETLEVTYQEIIGLGALGGAAGRRPVRVGP